MLLFHLHFLRCPSLVSWNIIKNMVWKYPDVHVLLNLFSQGFFVISKYDYLIDDKFRKYRLQDFVHHFSKCDHSEQNQLVLSFRAIFVICLSEISGWTYLEIFPSETSVVSHKDKFINISLHLILTEKLEQIDIGCQQQTVAECENYCLCQ